MCVLFIVRIPRCGNRKQRHEHQCRSCGFFHRISFLSFVMRLRCGFLFSLRHARGVSGKAEANAQPRGTRGKHPIYLTSRGTSNAQRPMKRRTLDPATLKFYAGQALLRQSATEGRRQCRVNTTATCHLSALQYLFEYTPGMPYFNDGLLLLEGWLSGL